MISTLNDPHLVKELMFKAYNPTITLTVKSLLNDFRLEGNLKLNFPNDSYLE